MKTFVFLFFLISFEIVAASNESQLSSEAVRAIDKGDIEKVRQLVEQGLDPNYKLGEPENPMGLAVYYEKPEILSYLISEGGNIDHKIDDRMFFINFVATRENLELLKIVVNENSDLNKLMLFDQYTIFTGILRKIDSDGLVYILNVAEVDINLRPKYGYSPLYHMYERGKCGLECIEIMLRKCADPSLEVEEGGLSFREHVFKKNDHSALALIDKTKCEKDF